MKKKIKNLDDFLFLSIFFVILFRYTKLVREFLLDDGEDTDEDDDGDDDQYVSDDLDEITTANDTERILKD